MDATLSTAQETWRRRTAVPLLVASGVFLIAYSWRVIADLHGPNAIVLTVILLIARAMFVVDYLARLTLADDTWLWFRTHLADLAITLVPVLRLVRLLRVFTDLPGIRHTRAALRRNRLAVYGIGSVVLLVYIAALQVLDAERPAPGATIINFGDAIWWACTTATTTGYGDFTPITVIGRMVGIALMFSGVILIGILTATMSSWVTERARNTAEPAPTDAPPRESEDPANGAP